MGKKSKRVRTKQTKEENNKVKATLIAKLKIGRVSGLRYETSSVRKAINKLGGKQGMFVPLVFVKVNLTE
tara:strand:+ start:1135 stop:1344 length:210 start_codon:yes stop_codon:yes gene_type:complete